MSDVERLLSEYVAAERAGAGADPREYVERAEPARRAELAALIDAYLERAPRRPFEASAFAASATARALALVEAEEASAAAPSGGWRAALPALRERAQVTRDALVRQLATALGVSGSVEKVRRYYHAMERGALPAAGVGDRVLEALGAIVGESAATLRRAAQASGSEREGGVGAPSEGDGPAPAFARTAIPGDGVAGEPDALPAGSAPGVGNEPWDAVDELFRGGGGGGTGAERVDDPAGDADEPGGGPGRAG